MTSATDPAHDRSHQILERQVVEKRLAGITREATRVLGLDENSVVMWRGDLDNNGKVNISELQTLRWDSATSTITLYRATNDIALSDDTSYEPDDDFLAISSELEADSVYADSQWCTGVTSFSIQSDVLDKKDMRLLRFRLTLQRDSWEVEVNALANLRR